MSHWEELNIEAHIREILGEIEYCREHHFERPFLTAYQLAIKFNQRFPNEARELGFLVGGEGVGERNSLAQYLAGQLSKRISSGELQDIEGAFISNNDLQKISFKNGNEIIVSSLTETQYDLSMFRLVA
jgi:hypothetical protein